MAGPGGLAFLLLCLVLVSQVDKSKAYEAGQKISRKDDVTPGNEKEAPSQVQVYIVNGVGRVDGIYEEQGTPPLHYKRMGKANKYGSYYYLYPGTKQPDTWVLGAGKSTRTSVARYRASAGGESSPPERGWQYVWDGGSSRDGRASGEERSDMRVDGFKIKEVTAKAIFKTGGEKIGDGLLCKVGDVEDDFNGEEWSFLPKVDERLCNGLCNCGNCRDEEECEIHREFKDIGFLMVRGVEPQQNGVYQLVNDSNNNPQFFRHTNMESGLIIHRKDGGWALSIGTSPENVTEVLFTSATWTFGISGPVWEEGDNGPPNDMMRVASVSTAFSMEQMMNGDWEKDEGIVCDGFNNQRLFIEKTEADPFYCDKRNNCPKSELDERSCYSLVDITFEQPIFSTFGAVGVGVLLFFVFRKSLKGRNEGRRSQVLRRSIDQIRSALEGKRKSRRTQRISQRLRRSIDQIVDQARMLGKEEKEPDSMGVDEVSYKVIHETPGGLRALIGTGYSLLSHPGARHMLAKFIVKEEKKIHGEGNVEAWQECVRRKAGSNKTTAAFLKSIDEPGCWKRFKYKVKKVINWMTDHPDNLHKRCNLFRSRFKTWLSLSFFPLLSVTLYVFDYIKDCWMANYLFRRIGFINHRCNLLYGLVYVYGASIGVAGLLMGFVFQTDSALLGFDPSSNWFCIFAVRLLLFILTPFLPIMVIMKAVELTGKKEDLKAQFRDLTIEATSNWERIREVDEEKKEVMEALSDLKMVECSTEAVVQLLLLLVFTFASVLLPTTSGLGLLKDDNIYEWTFLTLSFLTTVITVNKAILDAMDIQKNGQLASKQKVILAISFTFQILSHVFLIVSIALLALPLTDNPVNDREKASLTVANAAILLAAPIILRWISIAVLHCCLAENETRFWDLTKRKRFLHVLANTWVTMPVRNKNVREQVRKETEIRWSMGLAGINILVTWGLTASLMKDKDPRFLSVSDFNSNNEFLLVGALPSLLCYLVGCAFHILHYKAFHPWRNLYTLQKSREIRASIKEETPCWEEVKKSRKSRDLAGWTDQQDPLV